MPVSTRSQIAENESNRVEASRRRARSDQEEETHLNIHLRNPHHGLKEKMKALTLLYEQQKKAAAALRNPSPKPEDKRFTTHPSVELLGSQQKEGKFEEEMENYSNLNNVMGETLTRKIPNSSAFVLSRSDKEESKENRVAGSDPFPGFSSCAKKETSTNKVARKLSMGGLQQGMEDKGVEFGRKVQEMEKLGPVSAKSGSRILVFVRLRPMGKKEKEAGSRCCVKIVNGRDVYLSEFANENDYLRLKRLRGRHFTFDAAFPDFTTQQQVYSTSTAELVESVLEGRNGSVFCYGATGAGKTYTMLGTMENPGVMVLAIKDLFAKIRQRSCDGNHVVHLSYLEVYNETIRDLLSPGRPLVLREDKQGIVVAGLTQYRAYSTDEVMALLQQGNRNRTTEPTRANETSSRSHAILQVVIEYRVKDASMKVANRVGKLSLIDLAGSERALATDQRTLRSLEGANINRSLLALSSCINALVEGKKHIPYRNSKLTQLLKDSLSGACNTVMIANISPSNLSFDETQNTLHWADRAKEIRTKDCEANEELVIKAPESAADQAELLLELQKENRELRVQLARQQQKLLTLQAKSITANASPTPSSVTSLMTPPSTAKPGDKRRTRSTFLAGTCFSPDYRKRVVEDEVQKLKLTIKSLEAELVRIKKYHASQLKQKDDMIQELLKKTEKASGGAKRMSTRSVLRPKEPNTGELKSPSHRFRSPAATAKKRSIWDITTANSPSITTLNGRKTRTHLAPEPAPAPAPAPSQLLQPGFARQRPSALK